MTNCCDWPTVTNRNMTDNQVRVVHQWQIQPIIMSASTVLVPPLVWPLRFRFGSVPREGSGSGGKKNAGRGKEWHL